MGLGIAMQVVTGMLPAMAAELSVGDITVRPASSGEIVVSGAIFGESTFGVTVMAEISPRKGSTGTVTFTASLNALPVERDSFIEATRADEPQSVTVVPRVPVIDSDIVPSGDPWPNAGSFTRFDTDRTNSTLLNGTVDDNGTFVASPLTFSGALASFPIFVSREATGVWDVRLSTSLGRSGWEGVTTTLRAGTITISADACLSAADCDDRDACTEDACEAGRCSNIKKRGKCDEAGPEGSRGLETRGGAANGEKAATP